MLLFHRLETECSGPQRCGGGVQPARPGFLRIHLLTAEAHQSCRDLGVVDYIACLKSLCAARRVAALPGAAVLLRFRAARLGKTKRSCCNTGISMGCGGSKPEGGGGSFAKCLRQPSSTAAGDPFVAIHSWNSRSCSGLRSSSSSALSRSGSELIISNIFSRLSLMFAVCFVGTFLKGAQPTR